jgi:ABC-type amino acid transport substrate-binding protein
MRTSEFQPPCAVRDQRRFVRGVACLSDVPFTGGRPYQSVLMLQAKPLATCFPVRSGSADNQAIRLQGIEEMRSAILGALLVTSGCSDIPRDAAGTLDKIRQSGVMRVGIVSDAARPPEEMERIVAQLAKETGSRPLIAEGSPEALLPKIEDGALDIVIGRFAPDSPWNMRVTFLPALEEMDVKKGVTAPVAAVRNGENDWVELVHGHTSRLTKP